MLDAKTLGLSWSTAKHRVTGRYGRHRHMIQRREPLRRSYGKVAFTLRYTIDTTVSHVSLSKYIFHQSLLIGSNLIVHIAFSNSSSSFPILSFEQPLAKSSNKIFDLESIMSIKSVDDYTYIESEYLLTIAAGSCSMGLIPSSHFPEKRHSSPHLPALH